MSERQNRGLRVLLAGGGTGGHVFPALAVARELLDRGCVVSWLGRSRGMERGLVEKAAIHFHTLDARPWVGRGVADKVRALSTLAASGLQARRLIRSEGVDVTVGTGGYVSAPAVVGSFLARRPVVLLEPNAMAGTANRLLSRLSSAACLGFEKTARQLSCKSYWTGTPVRPEFFAAGSPRDDVRSLLVVGGSQGALQLNELLPPIVDGLSRRLARLRVVHQTGPSHLESVRTQYAIRGFRHVKVVAFIEDMATAMAEASLIVSRAGALTLAEITAAGRPSVLLPLAAAGGHQRANAEQLAVAGAAALVETEDATVEQLARLLSDLLSDHARLESMSAAARGLAREGAAARIADLVEVLGGAN